MAAPVIKYIGRTTDFKGKTLWEIVGNLKDYGVGRVVVRHVFQRYPEPTFMKILKVEPLPHEEPHRKVIVTVQKTFRGLTLPKPTVINSVSYKADYQLIPKDEEEAFCRLDELKPRESHVLPRIMEFPPLLKILMEKEYKKKGQPMPEGMHISYNRSPNRIHKIAPMGEKGTLTVSIGLGAPKSPLYDGIFK